MSHSEYIQNTNVYTDYNCQQWILDSARLFFENTGKINTTLDK